MGIFLLLAFRNVNLAEAFSLISNVSIWLLLVFIFMFFISHVLRAVRWKVIISSVKPNTSIIHLLGATMIGYGVNCAVPRLGEIYRALFLGRWENISRSSMFGTIIVERIIDILALCVAVLISALIYSGNLYEEIDWLKPALYIGFILLLIVIALIVLVVIYKEKFYKSILRFVGKISHSSAEKLAYIFDMMADGFSSLKGYTNYIYSILLTIIIMIVYGFTTYLGLFLLGMNELQSISYEMAWILMSISAFGVIIPTPGGTGSYHLIVISVLVNLYGFGREISSAYAILTHIISYVVFILSTIFFIYFVNIRKINNGAQKENFFSVFKIKPDEK